MNRKSIDISSLVRANIRELTPYRSARDDFDSGVLMDANENALGAPVESALELNRYPSPTQDELRKRIAQYRGVQLDNVFLGVGSDEPIDLLIRIFCEPGCDAIITTPPTYGMYKVSARINNVTVREALLDEDFQLKPGAVEKLTDESTKILFLCSPNNPTANNLRRSEILALAGSFPGIVVVDEAYIDFSDAQSLASEIDSFPNLVILQTLSKAFGLAGIRLGIALANPEIIRLLLKIKSPYNINKLTAETAQKAFDNLSRVRENIDTICRERDTLSRELQLLDDVEHVYPSDANFLLFRINEAKEIYRKLAEDGVIIRYRGNEPGCDECLRVTVGTPEENRQFIESLTRILTNKDQ